MSRITRKKYKPKNPLAYLESRKCHECSDEGIISYRKGIAGTEHSCIPHIATTERAPVLAQVEEAKRSVTDLLDLERYWTRN